MVVLYSTVTPLARLGLVYVAAAALLLDAGDVADGAAGGAGSEGGVGLEGL